MGLLRDSPRLWDEGYPYWWELSEVVALDEPIACRGNVGMWTMPDELARRVTAADEAADLLGLRMLDHLIVTKEGFATIKGDDL